MCVCVRERVKGGVSVRVCVVGRCIRVGVLVLGRCVHVGRLWARAPAARWSAHLARPTHTPIHQYTHTRMHEYPHPNTHTPLYPYTHTSIRPRIYDPCTHIHIHPYTYTHTHTPPYRRSVGQGVQHSPRRLLADLYPWGTHPWGRPVNDGSGCLCLGALP